MVSAASSGRSSDSPDARALRLNPGAVEPLPLWKRSFDIVVAGSILIVAVPVLAVVALVTLLIMGRPLLYRQSRGGLGGSTFQILKIRTMLNERTATGENLTLEQRRHPWGDFLRRTSLDELPALINVLRGEMSVVGPRPLMATYLARYNDHEAQRHLVTPGLTGLAQTQGRNRLSWSERFELDVEYVALRSPGTDLRILLDTVKVLISRDGADGNVHCSEFRGSSSIIDLRRVVEAVGDEFDPAAAATITGPISA